MTIQLIPLPLLSPSPRNVRKAADPNIGDLAASIAAHGLLQNLTVCSAGDGAFTVEAGGRRLLALQQLASCGTIAPDFAVPCLVLDGSASDLVEASLAENVIRQDMHPADEFDAFAELARDGRTAAEIADRFGQTELYVRKRLKLANVSPAILQEYRDGKAKLEQVMALTLTDDHDTQLKVWRAARDNWSRAPDRLRDAITENEISVDSSLGRFVTVAAYEKAHGAIRRDLFGGDDDAHFCDTLLLRSLAEEKLQKTATKIAKEGWAWTEARIGFDWSDQNAFGKAPCEWKGSKQTWTAEAMANAGAVVTIGHNGQTEIHRGLVRPQDRKAAAQATGAKVTGGKEPKAAKKPSELSFAAVQRLQAEATAIVRADVATQPQTAMALLVTELARKALFDSRGGRQWVHISREHTGRVHSGPVHEAMQASPATKVLDALELHWRGKLPGKSTEILGWALEQTVDALAELLAFLVARETEAVDVVDGRRDDGIVALAKATGVDLALHWQATAEWFQSQPKAYVIAAVTEHCGKLAAAPLAKIKGKEALATEAARILELSETGPGHKPRWLPKPLRAPTQRKRDAKQKAANDGSGSE